MKYKTLLLCVLLSFGSLWQVAVRAQTHSRLSEIKDYTLVAEGVLSVFEKEGKIYLAIPQNVLGRELEIRGQINRGFDMVARPTESLGVVRIVKEDDTSICLHQEIYSERVLVGGDAKLIEAFKLSNIGSSDKCYDIETYSPKYGYLIEVTEDILRGDEWFSYKFGNIRQMDSEASKLIGVSPLSDGVSFKVCRMHGYALDKDKQISYVMILPQGTMPLEVECVLRILPERDMPIRLATYRSAPRVIKFRDYTQDSCTAVADSLLVRWDLSSSSKRPITFYVDSLFPEYYISAVRKSIEYWNKAFSKAGLSTPLALRKTDEGTSLASRRAVIAYDLIRPGVEEQITWHPRTGEILSCRINVGHGFMRDCLSDYLLTHALSDDGIVKDNDSRYRAVAIIEELLREKIGLVLGVYQPEDLGWCYRTYPGVKDCYEDRERGLSLYGRQKADRRPTPVSVYEKRLSDLSTVMFGLETIVSERTERDISRKVIALYPRGYELYGRYLKELFHNYEEYAVVEQAKAQALLDQYLFEGKDLMDAPYMRLRLNTDLWQIQEPIHKDLFQTLFSMPDREGVLSTFIHHVCQTLFGDAETMHSPYRMNLQYLFVSILIEQAGEKDALRSPLVQLYHILQSTLVKLQGDSRIHYEAMSQKIRQSKMI